MARYQCPHACANSESVGWLSCCDVRQVPDVACVLTASAAHLWQPLVQPCPLLTPVQSEEICRLRDVVVEVAVKVRNTHDFVGLAQEFRRLCLKLVRLVRHHNARKPRRPHYQAIGRVFPAHLGGDDYSLAKVRHITLSVPDAAVAVQLVHDEGRVGLGVLAPDVLRCFEGETAAVRGAVVWGVEGFRLVDAL